MTRVLTLNFSGNSSGGIQTPGTPIRCPPAAGPRIHEFLKRGATRFLLILALVVPMITGCDGAAGLPEAGAVHGRPRADEMVEVLWRDAIPAILQPKFLTVSEAHGKYFDSEPIIGVEIAGEARAYSIDYLNHHEVINDRLAGQDILVTW